jgi:hypothetical protein
MAKVNLFLNISHQSERHGFIFYIDAVPMSMTGLRPYLSATMPHNAEVMKRPSIMADPVKETDNLTALNSFDPAQTQKFVKNVLININNDDCHYK